jgi:PKD repeat protein
VLIAAEWNFGDGSGASGLVACHPYKKAGGYLVTLIVQDANRNCDQVSQSVTVTGGELPTCQIIVSPTTIGAGDKVYFTGVATDPDGKVTRYAWNFGDGKTGTGTTTSHVYDVIGSYTVVLTVYDDQGNSSICQATVNVTTGTPPTCSFSFSPSSPSVGQGVSFSAAASSDSDGTIVSYAWDFGDGSTGSGVSASHSYGAGGTYTVTLTVTDNDGNVTSCSNSVTVVGAVTCSFGTTPAPPTGTSPLTITFDATGTSSTGGTITSYAWDFGDGATGTGVGPSHIYTAPTTTCTVLPCSFTARLTATDSNGSNASCTTVVTVN